MRITELVNKMPHERSTPCPTAEELAVYLEQQADPVLRQSVEKHLIECAACRSLASEVVHLTQVGHDEIQRMPHSLRRFLESRCLSDPISPLLSILYRAKEGILRLAEGGAVLPTLAADPLRGSAAAPPCSVELGAYEVQISVDRHAHERFEVWIRVQRDAIVVDDVVWQVWEDGRLLRQQPATVGEVLLGDLTRREYLLILQLCGKEVGQIKLNLET